MGKSKYAWILNTAVIVAALGYFVDVFDLLLFAIVRKSSLADLGLSEKAQISQGLLLFNLQMGSVLLGGILWGMLGDRRGRLSVLFGSIAIYSIGNICNAFVHTVGQYAVCRCIAGLGLAGELGAGITLVAETLPKDKRGWRTTIVATVGLSGAVVAALLAEVFQWRTQYAIGGVLGLALLVLRINTAESLLFKDAEKRHTKIRGNYFSLFTNRSRFTRYINSILIGVPIWFVIGILIQLAPEFGKEFGLREAVTGGRAVMWAYIGTVFGDFCSGLISQYLKSRTKVIYLYLAGVFAAMAVYFTLGRGASANQFYAICAFIGLGSGYWAMFVTMAAEQFGTNLRATVATSVPNIVRGSVIPVSMLFQKLAKHNSMMTSAMIVAALVLVLALLANMSLKDTFHEDLSYLEA